MTFAPQAKKPIIAVFDFDGTITTRDSFIPFLVHTAGLWPTTRKLTMLVPEAIKYLFRTISRQELKEKILMKFFAGMPISQLREHGEAFARSASLASLIRPEAKRRIEWHKQQKHRCILISAAIDSYLEPWGRLMGFDDTICSHMEITTTGAVTGKLKGLNCRGKEKVRCLEALIGSTKNFTIYAYGDSPGDKELLSIADYPFMKKMKDEEKG